MPETILIVDDEPTQLRMMEYAIGQKLNYRTVTVSNTEEAIRWVLSGTQPQPDLMLLDLTKTENSGLQMLRTLRAYKPRLPIIVLIRYGEDAYAAQVMQAGAGDFLTRPIALERLNFSIQNALRLQRMSEYIGSLERTISGHADFSDIIGDSPPLKGTLKRAGQAAAGKMPVWIEGERGTGKELLARAIHGSSDRAGKPFVIFDGRTMTDERAQAALFGQDKEPGMLHFALGKLREADGGTLLIKNIGMLSSLVQRRLLAVMDEKRVILRGTDDTVPVDVRIICASSEEAKALLAQDRLSHMLSGRFGDMTIALPPLRDRHQDIPQLARHFIQRFASSENKVICGITESGLQILSASSWPGNIRQLSSLLWRAVMVCDRDRLDADELRVAQKSPQGGYADHHDERMMTAIPVLLDGHGRLKKLKSIEEEVIRFALRHANGCMTRAARSLGIGRSTLYRRVNELGMDGYISRANHTTRPMMKVSEAARS